MQNPVQEACSPGWARLGRLPSSLGPGTGWAAGATARLASLCRSLKLCMARDLLSIATLVRPTPNYYQTPPCACTTARHAHLTQCPLQLRVV